MTGMILAAGFGTRLGALTREMPKALVPLLGRPMIDHVIGALERAGCDRIVINAHHHADALVQHVRGLVRAAELIVVTEDEILGTGGGILHARPLLGDAPFIVHNADIFSRLPLGALMAAHRASGAAVTLVTRREPSSRPLVFDASMRFLGKQAWAAEGMRYPDDALRLGFTGIHIIDPALLDADLPVGFLDVFDMYRPALAAGARICGVVADGYWTDLGTPERLAACEAWLLAHTDDREPGVAS